MNKKILIINDQNSLLDVIKLILTSEGYTVAISQNYENSVDLVIKEKPDAIILDNDSKIPGELIATLLKKNQETKHIPILLLVNKGSMAGGIKLESATSSKLLKPFKPDALLKSMRNLF